jgi:hypothetical protein
MDGTRKASAHDIVFQARAGSPELNCCSVNGARGFGLISDWAVMKSGDGLLLNWYGPSTITARLEEPLPEAASRGRGIGAWFGAKGREAEVVVTLTQETDYPRENHVRLEVSPSRTARFPLRLRIPHWSRATRVKLNGKAVENVTPGSYLTLDRNWKRGDTIDLELDFSLHYWSGERECAGKASIYRGPLLLTYDRRFNVMDPDRIPPLDAKDLRAKVVSSSDWLPPLLLLEMSSGANTLRLCDFGSAGVGGSPYRSWLDVKGVADTPFSRTNPLRSAPVG